MTASRNGFGDITNVQTLEFTTTALMGLIDTPADYEWLLVASRSHCSKLKIGRNGADHVWHIEYEPNRDLGNQLNRLRQSLRVSAYCELLLIPLLLLLTEIHIIWYILLDVGCCCRNRPNCASGTETALQGSTSRTAAGLHTHCSVIVILRVYWWPHT